MPMKNLTMPQTARWKARHGWHLRSASGGAVRVYNRERNTGTPVIDFPYDRLVATGEVNRDEWAKIVRELLAEYTRGKKATFARMLGMDPKTIDNWLTGRVRVSEESIRDVAALTDRNAMDLLIRVGYYELGEMPHQPTPEQIDEEQRTVVEADGLTDEQKAAILMALDEMRATDERLRAELAERDRQRRMREIDLLIRQARSN